MEYEFVGFCLIVILCVGIILFWFFKVIDIVYNCGLVNVNCIECGLVYYFSFESELIEVELVMLKGLLYDCMLEMVLNNEEEVGLLFM